MRGPSLFIGQYIGPPPLFERLADIAAPVRRRLHWRAGHEHDPGEARRGGRIALARPRRVPAASA